jgi:Protein of unknown function (DUF2939)
MKKLFLLVLLGLLGFYVAWPAWSGYQIYTALEDQDSKLLESKIDFDSVRDSLRPVVATEVDKQIEVQMKQLGQGLPIGDLKKQLAPKLVDATLTTIVTPANIMRIYREREDIAGAVRKIMSAEMGKQGGGGGGGLGGVLGAAGAATGGGQLPGGVGGLGKLGDAMGKLGIPGLGGGGGAPATQAPAAEPAQAPASPPAAGGAANPAIGLGNIKSFGFEGPLAMQVGVARNAAAAGPDLTAGIAFRGSDWKLTKLVPRLQ